MQGYLEKLHRPRTCQLVTLKIESIKVVFVLVMRLTHFPNFDHHLGMCAYYSRKDLLTCV